MSIGVFVPEEAKTSLVTVTGYERGCMRGAVSNPAAEGFFEFNSAVELILTLERIFDRTGFPVSDTRIRTFADVPAPEPRPCEEPSVSLALFAVSVRFRRGAAWQGSVRWAEGKKESDFRSVLELIHLFDSALRAQQKPFV